MSIQIVDIKKTNNDYNEAGMLHGRCYGKASAIWPAVAQCYLLCACASGSEIFEFFSRQIAEQHNSDF